jgi:glycosyltransferase involved in cell wall biosynthesis
MLLGVVAMKNEESGLLWVSDYPVSHAQGGWGGGNHYLNKALSVSQPHIIPLAPIGLKADYYNIWMSRFLWMLTGKRLMAGFSNRRLAMSAAEFARRSAEYEDRKAVLFYGIAPYLRIFPDRPYFCYTDCSCRTVFEWYGKGRNYIKGELRRIEDLERDWLAGCTGIYVSSEWAKRDMLSRYSLDPSRIVCVYGGANIEYLSEPKRESGCGRRLLFVAADFISKRGDVLVAGIDRIIKTHPDIQLNILGAEVPTGIMRDYIRCHGWIDKTTDAGRKRFDELMESVDLCVSCSLADCTAFSICEVCAYGLPSVVMDVGGMSELVVNGVNGWVLPRDSSAEQIGDHISSLFASPEKLKACGRNARIGYETKWNWDLVAKKIIMNITGNLSCRSIAGFHA